MPDIPYKEFGSSLEKISATELPTIYLLYGEEYLSQKVLNILLDRLCPGDDRALSYEAFDGLEHSASDVLDSLNTYAFGAAGKTVGYIDARIFTSKKESGASLAKIKETLNKGNVKKAAKLFLDLLSVWHFSIDSFDRADRDALVANAGDDDFKWIDSIVDHCRDSGLTVPPSQDPAAAILAALDKGFPRGNRLIIVTATADKRRQFYKKIKDKGLIIDCSMPKGNRKADKDVQAELCRAAVRSVLSTAGKKMAPDAMHALLEMTGPDLRLLAVNTGKLVNYVGDKEAIGRDDVGAVLKRTKEDPIYELTGALADRQAARAFFYLKSLLAAGIAPLQVLAAMINQMRRLLVMKDFAESDLGRGWRRDMPYFQFQSAVFPSFKAYDDRLAAQLDAWGSIGDGQPSPKKKAAGSDLMMTRKSKSPYPLYQTLMKSSNFTRDELIEAAFVLERADRQLKTTGQAPVLVLETVIVAIAGVREDGSH
jgi:DNA polymerase-3 subunit delta